jgi:hypothetical protein
VEVGGWTASRAETGMIGPTSRSICRYDPEGGKCYIDGGCCPSDNFVVTTKSK